MLVTRLNIGGPAVQVITLARNLPNDSFHAILASGRISAGEGDMGYLADIMGIQPVLISNMGREIYPLNDLVALIAIVKLILQTDPDILHTHTAKAGTLGRIAVLGVNLFRSAKKRIRVVHTFHGHTFHSYFGTLKTNVLMTVERVLAIFTDRIIAISALQKRDLCERYHISRKGRVITIPLGFNLSEFGKIGDQKRPFLDTWFPNTSASPLLVGAVGRLTPVKNPEMLLQVADILRKWGEVEAFRFVFVGDGELRSKLERESVSRKLGDLVVFTGWRRDINRIYGALDAVLLTSTNEGTPVSLIEAMASRTPVIATDVGGVRDLMGQDQDTGAVPFRPMENGILIDSLDPMAMAAALIHLKNHSDDFTGRADNAFEFVRKRYTTDRVLKDHETLYDSLITT